MDERSKDKTVLEVVTGPTRESTFTVKTVRTEEGCVRILPRVYDIG